MSRAVEVPFQAELGTGQIGSNYDWTAYDAFEASSYGVARRGPVFHYALFCNSLSDHSVDGVSRGEPGTEVVYMFGEYKYSDGTRRTATALEEALVVMHELGHNLGLDHGGETE